MKAVCNAIHLIEGILLAIMPARWLHLIIKGDLGESSGIIQMGDGAVNAVTVNLLGGRFMAVA
jgi:hypothetical protein